MKIDQDHYYVTSCVMELCAGGKEYLEEPEPKCNWCGAEAEVHRVPMNDRARERFECRAQGWGFISNAKETIPLKPNDED